MKALAEIAILFIELLEAEARAFRKGIIRLGIGIVLLAVAGGLLLGAIGLIVWAFYLTLVGVMPPAAAALLSGLIVLIFAGGLLWGARRAVS
jgi:hypothetical protein